MRRNELIELRELVLKERENRKKVNELLEDELVKEYLKAKGIEDEPFNDNLREVIKEIVKDFKITKTNGIYVCTSSYYFDCRVCYEDMECYIVDVDIDSKYAERKTYVDIESKQTVRASVEKTYGFPLIEDFEREHLILNPYNTNKNCNGLEEVRLDFLEMAIEKGQAKSKRNILSKYPILRTHK